MRPDAHTLLAAYAADSLDPADRADVQAHLAECAGCRDDLYADRETLTQLALLVAEAPPARMRESVLRAAGSIAQLPPLVPTTVPAARQSSIDTVAATATGAATDTVADQASVGRSGRRQDAPSRALFGLAATVLAATTVGASVWGYGAVSELSTAREQQAAVQRVLGADDVITVRGDVTLPDGSVGDEVVVLASAGSDSAVLLAEGLPAAPEGSTWQAWTLSGDDVRAAGVFDVSDQTTVALSGGVDDADAVAVSLEPAGGSPAPTTTPVVVLPLA